MEQETSRRNQPLPGNPPDWIPRLCAAISEAMADRRLPNDAYNTLGDFITELQNDHCSDYSTLARTTLPVSLSRACGFEPPAQQRQGKQPEESLQKEGGQEEFAEILQSLIAPLRRLLEHDCMDDDAAGQICDGFLLMMNDAQSGNQTAADITEVAIKSTLKSLRQRST